MTFPTVPTAAAGRVLVANQADSVATRTFPNLSGLTKNSGDLLIAIVVGYQSTATANAVWSGWTAGWTEFVDQSSSTTLAIGAAYKWSTGSETGTISVTEAATITGHASMILLSIPGSDGVTAPQATAIANGTAAAATLPTLTPSWGAADTLWIAVGANGEVSATGSWTGTGGAAPTNYGSYADTATADTSTVGQTALAVAFRQLNATSDGGGTFGSTDLSNARNSALMIAVAPAQPTGGATLAVSSTINATGATNITGGTTLQVTSTINADGSVTVPIPGGGAATREGRYGRSIPPVTMVLRNPQAAATPGQGDAVLNITSSITADGSVLALATPQPVVVGQAEQQALFLRTRGTPYPALISRSSSADPGIGSNANLAVTGSITATGSAGGSASLPVTATLTAAAGTSAGTSLPVTAAIIATGTSVSGFSGSATLAVTATITAAGAVAISSSAALTATASRSAAGVVGTSAGASLAATATITAAGTVVSGSAGSASLPVTATLTSAGQVARFATVSLPVLATLAATGNMAAATGATRPVTVTFTATGQVISAGDGVPVKNPGTVLTMPIPGITLTIPDTTTTLTLPATRTVVD